ncbi:G-protein coupled receptor Mth2-like isoform X2 [Palaemon carinicauda]|uniref:G-protein coupled receptor Mth2-like isoform X2 n=1 Tax=Palaemon carinicauda TaxID=392227 RepID=UPI0035B57358
MWASTIFRVLLIQSATIASAISVNTISLQRNVSYVTSADDSEIQSDETESTVYSVVLQKCFCEIDESWNGTACEKNKSSTVVSRICMEPPTVPSCCPLGHSLDLKGSCSATSTRGNNFSPPVMLQNQTLRWPSGTGISLQNISCTDMEKMIIIELNDKDAMMSINANTSMHSTWTPSLFIESISHSGDYCIGVRNGSENTPVYLAKFCIRDQEKDHEKTCSGKTCIRKCCQENEYYNDEGCQSYPNYSSPLPSFYDVQTLNPVGKPQDLAVVYGAPLCKETYLMNQDEFKVLQNGGLYSAAFPEPYPPTKYCVESEKGDGFNMAVVCMVKDLCHELQQSFQPYLVLLSAIFLGITLCVYLCIPEMHAKVHGKCVSSHVSALFIAFLTLFAVHQFSKKADDIGCKFMASVMQFSFLAAFFWLNVMCFDIWWTLRSMRLGPEPSEQTKVRFRLYSLYSWGLPLVITAITAIIDSLPEDINVIRADFGKNTCWFDSHGGDKAIFLYFYGIILVLIIANIFFFFHVMYLLLVQQHNSILEKTRKQNWQRLCLYAKLFMIMGITWLAEVVSWQYGDCRAWIVTDVVNGLQGVLIFLIYVCKKKDLKKIRDKWEAVVRHLKEKVRSRNRPRESSASSQNGTGPPETSSSISYEKRTKSTEVSLGSLQPGSSLEIFAERSVSSVSTNPTNDEEQLQNIAPSDVDANASRSGTSSSQANCSSVPPAEGSFTDGKIVNTKEGSDIIITGGVQEEASSERNLDIPDVSIDIHDHEDEENTIGLGSCDAEVRSTNDGSDNGGDFEVKPC